MNPEPVKETANKAAWMKGIASMNKTVASLMAGVIIALSNTHAGMEITKMTPCDEMLFARLLLPMPQRLAIGETITLRPASVGMAVAGSLGAAGNTAVQEFKDMLKAKTGADISGTEFVFRFLLVPTDPELKKLPNAAQAYRIAADGRQALDVTAVDDRGIFYAVRTLRQLLGTAATPEAIVIPLADILDWPDFEERGIWNGQSARHFERWADIKLNFANTSSKVSPIIRGQSASCQIDGALLERARSRAFNIIPKIEHLNFLHRYGLFDAYPELKGQGKEADAGSYFAHGKGRYSHPVPCASNPLLAKIIADWMADLARQGANEISCWLSERPAQCQCDNCLASGQFVLEAAACVQAWENARRQYPNLKIRLFISTTTDSVGYYRLLATLPQEVRVERACAAEMGRVRHSPRDLFRNALFDGYASAGVWMASYDAPINVNGAVETPEFKLPECSAERVRDFVEQLYHRGYKAVYGMMAWRNFDLEICGYNIAALAEWSWNVKGRSPREFALAWATRAGLDPDAFAEWAACMGPVEFDVYDSDLPECYTRSKAVEMIRNKLYPELGEGMFRYYASPAAFDDKIRACERALKIAGTLKDPRYALETRVVMSYAKLARSVYRIALSNRRGEQPGVVAGLQALNEAAEENAAAIMDWRAHLGPEPWHPRVNDAIMATRNTVREIQATLVTPRPLTNSNILQ